MMRFFIPAALLIFAMPLFAQDKPITLTCFSKIKPTMAEVSIPANRDTVTVHYTTLDYGKMNTLTFNSEVVWLNTEEGSIWSEVTSENTRLVFAYQPDRGVLKTWSYEMLEEDGEQKLSSNLQEEFKCISDKLKLKQP